MGKQEEVISNIIKYTMITKLREFEVFLDIYRTRAMTMKLTFEQKRFSQGCVCLLKYS